ncbi:hypothetical protein F2Q68_00004512 [Brassica cretica]|uniref:Uncharacterized protein n=1 Tax=Brassica cretica TaxID=69181 RepID=A0A8S9JA79_BRACR|nr:hypothetical protein F2Q68_00004512 [Brassica cretica]
MQWNETKVLNLARSSLRKSRTWKRLLDPGLSPGNLFSSRRHKYKRKVLYSNSEFAQGAIMGMRLKAGMGSSGFHKSTAQGHPSIDCGLPPGADCNVTLLRLAKNQGQSSTNVSTIFIRHGNYCSPQTTCPRNLLWYQESTRLSPGTKTNMLNIPPVKSQVTIPRRGKKLQLQHQNLKEHQVY